MKNIEYDQFLEKSAIDASNILHISLEEAKKRIIGLLKSGILQGHPDNPETQMHIDAFMQIPSSDYDHLNNKI